MSMSGRRPDEFGSTLHLIRHLSLPHPGAALLSAFITDALDSAAAADYVRYRHRESGGELESLLRDWILIIQGISQHGIPPPKPDAATTAAIIKRDGQTCCVSGLKGAWGDPLIVAPVLPVPTTWLENKNSQEILRVFFGPGYSDWWFDYVRDYEFSSPYHNHWLVRSSVADALRRGTVKLERKSSSMLEFEVTNISLGAEEPVPIDGSIALLGDHSRRGIEKVDPRFVGSSGRFCKSIQLVNIAKSLAPELIPGPASAINSNVSIQMAKSLPTQSPRASILSWILKRPLISLWLLFSSKIRIAVYDALRQLGRRRYGAIDSYAPVQRLPFGWYMKYRGEHQNEFNALRMVRRFTSIPVPEPVDLVCKPSNQDDIFDDPETYLITTRVPGTPLAYCHNALSDSNLKELSLQLKDFIAQLRDIPKQVNLGMAICNTLGKECRDPRVRDADPIGPFVDEAAFSQELRYSDDPARRGHEIVFTHADLNPRNILVRQVARRDGSSGWEISGIVDWENAGFYPEYWDYTKSMFESFRWPQRYNDMVHNVFADIGDYTAELNIERRSWESGDGV